MMKLRRVCDECGEAFGDTVEATVLRLSGCFQGSGDLPGDSKCPKCRNKSFGCLDEDMMAKAVDVAVYGPPTASGLEILSCTTRTEKNRRVAHFIIELARALNASEPRDYPDADDTWAECLDEIAKDVYKKRKTPTHDGVNWYRRNVSRIPSREYSRKGAA
jgi:hypothetical protein